MVGIKEFLHILSIFISSNMILDKNLCNTLTYFQKFYFLMIWKNLIIILNSRCIRAINQNFTLFSVIMEYMRTQKKLGLDYGFETQTHTRNQIFFEFSCMDYGNIHAYA